MHDAAYSVDAVDLLSPLFACINVVKSAVYRTVAHNPMFTFSVSPVMVPKTDKQAQEQDCVAYWNVAKARCSAVLDDSLVHWMQRVLGSLMCILRSRPDMLHAIHLLACFVHNSAQDLDYDCRFHLSGDAIHPNLELGFKGLPGVVVCVLVLIHGRYVVQSKSAVSSRETVYYASSSAAKEGEYVSLHLTDLGPVVVSTLLCEHQPAIQVGTAKGFSQGSQTHLIAWPMYRDFVLRGDLLIESVPTDDQVADIYTTQLGSGPYTWHCGCFCVIDSLSLPVVLVLFCCLQLYPLVIHCGGAQTRNDSDLKRRVSDLDVQALVPETGGEVFLLLITGVCPLIFRSLITEVLPLIFRRSDYNSLSYSHLKSPKIF